MTAAPGALDLLAELKRRGILTAVATNDNAHDAGRDMRAIGAAPFIDFVAGADSVKRPKPAPDMIELICAKLKVDPARAIMVGDAVSDTIAGRQAGCGLTVGISGFVPRELIAAHCDVVIEGLDEIS
jgi:HAD superfamily hydrolase (TIGR01509 family)